MLQSLFLGAGCVVKLPPQLMGLCSGGKCGSTLFTFGDVNRQYGFSQPAAGPVSGRRDVDGQRCTPVLCPFSYSSLLEFQAQFTWLSTCCKSQFPGLVTSHFTWFPQGRGRTRYQSPHSVSPLYLCCVSVTLCSLCVVLLNLCWTSGLLH